MVKNALERPLNFVLLLITLPLLFLPKINIIAFEGETAGLRIDDLVLFGVGALLLWLRALKSRRLNGIEVGILLITLSSLLSFVTNRYFVANQILYIDAKIFYVVRLLEYFVFFYAGSIAYRYLDGKAIVQAFLVWNIAIMLLQKIGLVGGVSSDGYRLVAARVQGIASFPSEMGLLLNMLFCYMICEEPPGCFISLFRSPVARSWMRQIYPYCLFALFAIFVIFTGNRISIAALLLCFLWRIKEGVWRQGVSAIMALFVLVPLLLAAAAWIMTQTVSVYERSSDLFSFRNLELAQTVWDKIDISQDPMEEGNMVISSENYDTSWWIRIHKWVSILRAYLENPETYLFGVGPGYAGAALDGGILRVLTELGGVGALLFVLFFKALYNINKQTRWMVSALIINMLFFDAHLAYKTMSLLFFLCGYAFEEKKMTPQPPHTTTPLDYCTPP